MKKAFSIDEIDQAVPFNVPIAPNHPFFTDFSGLRGQFEEKIVYKYLNVKQNNGNFYFDYKTNSANKTLLFLGGMRGSGKTSELAKYTHNLNKPDCFFCVTCNIDEELDMDNMEYMDILIFQLEKLTQKLKKEKIKINRKALKGLHKWFDERIVEINNSIEGTAKLEVGASAEKGFLGKLLGVVGELKIGVSGTRERADIIRRTLKNKFNEFALKFNEYIEETNTAIREAHKGNEVLFVIDGIEKTLSIDTRQKIIMQESNRLRQIKAYTIFTLPIELMKKRQILEQFSRVETFPFVRLYNKDGSEVEAAVDRFVQFVYKRIDKNLFENEAIVKEIIKYCGGSPRELLRILETTAFYADEEKGVIDSVALEKALARLSNKASQYLTEKQLALLRTLKENNAQDKETPFDDTMQELLENIIVMEYNDGNFKRVNPLVEISKIYRERV